MAVAVTTPVFLEFYGLPGCGKSTVSHLAAQALAQKGYKVLEPTYSSDHRYPAAVRKWRKLLRLTGYCLRHPKRAGTLRKLICDNGFSGAAVLSHAANIAPKLWVYDRAEADYVIFDEGLTQSAVSLTQNTTPDSASNEKALYRLCRSRKIMKFYIDITEEEALRRMNGRQRHDSRIEKLADEKEKSAALTVFRARCEGIPRDQTVRNTTTDAGVRAVLKAIGKPASDDKEAYH